MVSGRLVRHGLLGRAPRGSADEDRARLRHGLDPRGRVDEIARNHPLAFGANGHGRLAGQDAGPSLEPRRTNLVPERGDGRDEIESSANRALGVVLGRHRSPPDRHHGVADELLDGSAVQRDQPAAGVEIA